MSEDYYKILGVSRQASEQEISKAYRELARKYHPDMNPDDATAKQKFQSVQRAYDVLRDSEKRKKYDQFGENFESYAGGGGGAGGAEVDLNDIFGGGEFGGFDFADIMRQFGGAGAGAAGGRGGGRTHRQPRRRGQDLQMEAEVPFQLAVLGGERQINIRRNGKSESLTVKIPAGIEDGAKMRLRNQGEQGAGGAGDLMLTLRVHPHPHFKRKGRDLHVVVPITLGEAAVGATVDIPTPHGTVSMNIKPGTSSGSKLRLKGMGVHTSAGNGDLYAEIQIHMPDSLSDDDLALLKQIADRHQSDPSPRSDLAW